MQPLNTFSGPPCSWRSIPIRPNENSLWWSGQWNHNETCVGVCVWDCADGAVFGECFLSLLVIVVVAAVIFLALVIQNSHQYASIFTRSIGTIDSKEIGPVIVLCWSMVRMSSAQTMVHPFLLTSMERKVGSGMRLGFAFRLATLFGCMAHSLLVRITMLPILRKGNVLKLMMVTLESLPSVSSAQSPLLIQRRRCTCNKGSVTGKSQSTIVSSSGMCWPWSSGTKFIIMVFVSELLQLSLRLPLTMEPSCSKLDTKIPHLLLRVPPPLTQATSGLKQQKRKQRQQQEQHLWIKLRPEQHY